MVIQKKRNEIGAFNAHLSLIATGQADDIVTKICAPCSSSYSTNATVLSSTVEKFFSSSIQYLRNNFRITDNEMLAKGKNNCNSLKKKRIESISI
uniref:Uncharacterized protein n=1 Tax=Ascaris lumbricoides TaxID=6252 RepID=A0A0M3HIM9_ASCLU